MLMTTLTIGQYPLVDQYPLVVLLNHHEVFEAVREGGRRYSPKIRELDMNVHLTIRDIVIVILMLDWQKRN